MFADSFIDKDDQWDEIAYKPLHGTLRLQFDKESARIHVIYMPDIDYDRYKEVNANEKDK